MASGISRSFSTIFGKSINAKAILNGKYLVSNPRCLAPCSAAISPPIRYSSFIGSNLVEPIDQYPKVEVVKNPPEWKYVERLLPKPAVPEPQPKAEYPSGWRPQVNWSHPYYVPRTKNHMVPVYFNRPRTVLRKIQGDIWLLERELNAYIELRTGKKYASRVNELSGQIWMWADQVKIVKDFLYEKGL